MNKSAVPVNVVVKEFSSISVVTVNTMSGVLFTFIEDMHPMLLCEILGLTSGCQWLSAIEEHDRSNWSCLICEPYCLFTELACWIEKAKAIVKAVKCYPSLDSFFRDYYCNSCNSVEFLNS